MKICVVQPGYSLDFSRSDEFFRWEMDMFDKCDESMDMIVFPEYSNVPCLAATKAEMMESYNKYNVPLMTKAAETAKRCNAIVFINGMYMTETGMRNTTVAFDRNGNEVGQYFKRHLVPSEMYTYELDKDYTFRHDAPTILEIDGVRYAFLICYDVYFYEAYANIARYNPDVIIACAYQRSDTHDALEIMARFCAYNCNAYVVRSSVSLGGDSPVGGTSMIVAPDGKVLADLRNEVSFACADIDPHKHYLKAAGFGNPPATHHAYIEAGRRPWQYRPGGSAIVTPDHWMKYPRVCAHRGFSSVAPENSLPAFGAAVALGAEEIEFDLWETKDGEIVSIHDSTLSRISNGHGYVWDHTLAELKELDFGSKHDARFAGLKIATLDEVLAKFSCHTVMNIHIKSKDDVNPVSENMINKIVAAIDKYDCRRHCYFMSGNPAILAQLQAMAPDITRCAGAADKLPYECLVDKALKYGCKKIQLFCPYFKKNGPDYVANAIAKAHANDIKVNLFYSDDPEEAVRYLEMGVDTILSNDYQRVAAAVEVYKNK